GRARARAERVRPRHHGRAEPRDLPRRPRGQARGERARVKALHLAAGNLYGGVESLLVTLARERGAAPGPEHELAVCFEGRLARELRAAGVAVRELGEVRVRKPWTIARARRRLEAIVGAGGTGAVVAHGCWTHAVFAPAVRRSGAALVHWAH